MIAKAVNSNAARLVLIMNSGFKYLYEFLNMKQKIYFGVIALNDTIYIFMI